MLETENRSTGAARMMLYWKTPSLFKAEKTIEKTSSTREVYLPSCEAWFDFWTGKRYDANQKINADAPADKIPLFIKAGSIIPIGPYLQYASEKPADIIELRIYRGADCKFTLYEDEDDNYNYEKGIYSTIDFEWDDDKSLLSIGDRKGKFPGMLETRKFNIVIVRDGKGNGIESTVTPDKECIYKGGKISISF